MNKRTLIAAPLSIIFQDQSLLLLFEDDHKTEIQYTELIVVYLAAKNGSTGEIYMPCITEVTADMDGYIIIYGAEMDYELHTYKTVSYTHLPFINNLFVYQHVHSFENRMWINVQKCRDFIG